MFAFTGASLSEVLTAVIDAFAAEDLTVIPDVAVLERQKVLAVEVERLRTIAVIGVGAVANRELFAMDGAGSIRSWLRQQLGGDQGQLALARGLAKRPMVAQALLSTAVS